jgi:hypothetical protein
MNFASEIWNKPTAAAAAAADEVTKSLRFEKSSTANLNQDNPSGADARQMTLSFWVKLVETPSADRKLFAFGGSAVGGTSQSEQEVIQKTDGTIYVRTNVINSGVYSATTTRVFRDFSSWYHIVIAWDTDQSVAADRMKFYVNNEQETLTGSFPALNYNDRFGETGTNIKNRIGCGVSGASTYLPSSSYMADIIRIDGQQLTPTSFAEEDATTGQWKPKAFVGVYGTAGFHLDFEDDTAIGNDVSGEGNDFTDSNLAATDVVEDTPENNWNTLLPLASEALTFSDGNLVGTGSSWLTAFTTIGVTSGKWYWEQRYTASNYGYAGVLIDQNNVSSSGYGLGQKAGGYSYYSSGEKQHNTAAVSYGTAWATNDIIGVALDMDNGAVYFRHNGTWQASGDPTSGASKTGAAYTGTWGTGHASMSVYGGSINTMNFGQDGTFAGAVTAQGNADTNSLGDFYYSVPSGYSSICTANLPTPTIAKPSEHFDTLTYTGSSSSLEVDGLEFTPNFVWFKKRNGTEGNYLVDDVRGISNGLVSNTTDAEDTYQRVTSFDDDGFTLVGANGYTNESSSYTYVAWSWKESATAGMDIVTWTGNDDGSGFTPAPQAVSHSLNVAPELIIAKSRTQNTFNNFSWVVWHKDLTSGNYLLLNGSGAETGWGNALISSSSSVTFGSDASMSGEDLNAGSSAWASADDYVAYLFASVEGYSKVGSYEGNNSTDGPFVYCGFRPRWICVKRIDGIGPWVIIDTARDPHNDTDATLAADTSSAESSYAATSDFDILSNGFKLRHSVTYGYANTADTYIFYSVAESPLKTANAR